MCLLSPGVQDLTCFTVNKVVTTWNWTGGAIRCLVSRRWLHITRKVPGYLLLKRHNQHRSREQGVVPLHWKYGWLTDLVLASRLTIWPMSDYWSVIHDKFRLRLICISIGIKKMKMNSRDDDLYAEAQIRRLLREMKDLCDGKGKGIWREDGASSSPLPSSLYSHSAIATDAVTPHPRYSRRP